MKATTNSKNIIINFLLKKMKLSTYNIPNLIKIVKIEIINIIDFKIYKS